jgi:hypothetical protein
MQPNPATVWVSTMEILMSRSPRITEEVKNLPEPERYCTCCNAKLSRKLAWLELDQRTNEYHDFGGVPQDRSQGWFPFGLGCAKTLIKQAELNRDNRA